jgi:hypothetical protein
MGDENSESELLSMDEEYFMVPANDLDKDTMQLHIINDDHLSGSQFFNVGDSLTSKSGVEGIGIERIHGAHREGSGRLSLDGGKKGNNVLYES